MPSKSFLFYLWVASTEEAFEVNVKARPIISCVHIQQIISISKPKPTVLWLDKLSFLMIKMIMSCVLSSHVCSTKIKSKPKKLLSFLALALSFHMVTTLEKCTGS